MSNYIVLQLTIPLAIPLDDMFPKSLYHTLWPSNTLTIYMRHKNWPQSGSRRLKITFLSPPPRPLSRKSTLFQCQVACPFQSSDANKSFFPAQLLTLGAPSQDFKNKHPDFVAEAIYIDTEMPTVSTATVGKASAIPDHLHRLRYV